MNTCNTDIVVLWLDGTDKVWLRTRKKWQEKLCPEVKLNNNNRYQDWNNLKYWFRAVESNMPWIRKIFLVTCGHLPSFLRTDHPKLSVVRHEEFIPYDYLPTFQANPIDLNLHRIPGLSEEFVYFNDDMFPLVPIEEEYYFQNGIVCDEAVETPIIPKIFGDVSQFTWNMKALDMAIINRNFSKREVQKKYRDKWFFSGYEDLVERNQSSEYWDDFTGIRDPHLPCSFKKSTFEKVWDVEYEVLDGTCMDKFRSMGNVNQWLMRYWQLCEGNFIPRRTLGKSYVVTIENYRDIANVIKNRNQQMICLNEQCNEDEFEIIRDEINRALEELLPQKSSYEK